MTYKADDKMTHVFVMTLFFRTMLLLTSRPFEVDQKYVYYFKNEKKTH